MSLTLRRTLVVAFAALSLTVAIGAAPASAATVTPNASESGCNYNNPTTLKKATLTHGNEVRTIELRYSYASACAWARIINGQVGDYMYVWNRDTGSRRNAYITSGHDAYTEAVHDNGTESHACMEPVYDRTIKVCTGFA
jgi:hypothetical protein